MPNSQSDPAQPDPAQLLPRPIDAVLLDVGGVFHLPAAEVLNAELGLALTDDDVRRAHYHGVAHTTQMGDDRVVWEAYNRAFAEQIDRPDVADALFEVFDGHRHLWSHVIDDAVASLRELAATGVGLAIVSNSDGTLEGRLAAAELCQVGAGAGVDVAIVCDSGACGCAKPDPAIFHLALDALGVAAGRAVHVGDMVAADVAGAHAAGVAPVHIDPFGLCGDDDHAHVVALSEVVDLVLASRTG